VNQHTHLPHLYQIRNLDFSYPLGKVLVHALRDVSFDIPASRVVCFSGPSGAGKTTLLNILGLIEPIQKGSVIFNQQDLKELSENEKNHLRRYHVGFIFQQFHLLPVLTAEENVEYFLARQGLPRDERLRLTKEALESVGLWEHRFKKTLEMSGGQRQRVAIARAIAKRPNVIIADEPTASLDQKTGREIMEILVQLSQKKGVSVVIASHDLMVHSYAEYHYQVLDGQVTLQEGKKS
jgi:putative ABC transport system ATP-binding protein